MKPPVVLVIWEKPEPEVQRKISSLPSALPLVRSLLEINAILVPPTLMEALELVPELELVIWVWVNCASAGGAISTPPRRMRVTVNPCR